MPRRNKSKDRREWARRIQVNTVRDASIIRRDQFGRPAGSGPFVLHRGWGSTSATMVSTCFKREALPKFSLIGPKMFHCLEKRGPIWSNSILRYNDLIKRSREEVIPIKSEEELIRMFFHEVAGEDEQTLDQVLQAWTDDLNTYIKKTIRAFKETPMYPPGSLLCWDGKFALQTWPDSIFDELKHYMTVHHRPASSEWIRDLNQLTNPAHSVNVGEPDNRDFVFIRPGTTMLVTEEVIVMGETQTSFNWNRLIRVMTTDGRGADGDPANKSTVGRPAGAVIGYNALLPKGQLDDCITILRKPSTLRKDRYPTFVFPEASFMRRHFRSGEAPLNVDPKEFERVEKMFLSFNEGLTEEWKKEGKR